MANDPSDKVRQLSGALPSAPPKQAPAGDMARGGTPKNYVQTPPTHGGHEQQPDGGRGHATATVIDGKAIKGAPGANPMAPPTQLKAGHGSQNVPIHPHMTDA